LKIEIKPLREHVKFTRAILTSAFLLTAWGLQAQNAPVALPATDSAQFYNDTKKPAIANPQTEYAPTIQADGKTIIFEAQTLRGNTYNLFSSKFDNGKWSAPDPLVRINKSGDSLDLIGGPSLSFDGNTLYFFRTVGIKANAEIFFSTRMQDGWSEPVNIGFPINSDFYEGFPSISADGSTLYFVGQNFEGPQSKELRKEAMFCLCIFKSTRNKEGKWGNPEKLPWPINQDCEKAPRIMADGKTLIFSSNRPGGKGGFDMYQSRLNDLGEWGMPENLSFVNSVTDDQLPCISAEGDLMYYTHDNADIYSVVIPPRLRQFMNNIVQGYVTDEDTREGIGAEIIVTDALTSEQVVSMTSNSSDGRYTVVLPVGRSFNIEYRREGYSSYTYPLDLRLKKKYEQLSVDVKLFRSVHLSLNVSDHELFVPIGANVGVREKGQSSFFKEEKTSAANGRITVDLPLGKDYEIVVTAQHFKESQVTLNVKGLVIFREFEKNIELMPEKIEVPVNVADLMNNSKVKSKVRIKNKNRDEIIEVEGNQMVSLRSGDRYEIEVTSDQGYAFNSTSLDLTTGQAAAAPIEVKLLKLEKNAELTLKEINFESNSDKLTDVSFTELSRVVQLMKENPTLKVEIAAHTDDVGSETYNSVLSEKRAKSVVDYMVVNKIAQDRFSAKGYGEGQFKFKNDSEDNRARNRRVELRILSI
jgi:outer membrane protein OmpA-like peptidoglycan-associated protein/Tol biopolymer transport system component